VKCALGALLLATSLRAQPLSISPAHPNSESQVIVSVGGTWLNGCTPGDPLVTSHGANIDVDLKTTPSDDCKHGGPSWSETISLGYLDPGIYRVRVFIDTQFFREGKVRVSDADSQMKVVANAAPERGGTTVNVITPLRFCYAPVCEPVTVSFGGVPAMNVKAGNQYNWLIVTAPPHAAGTVDVTITNKLGQTYVDRAAFYYFSESGKSDLSLFEPLLIPLMLDADGAGGTHWKTGPSWRTTRRSPI
jgi:hypothetical protein